MGLIAAGEIKRFNLGETMKTEETNVGGGKTKSNPRQRSQVGAAESAQHKFLREQFFVFWRCDMKAAEFQRLGRGALPKYDYASLVGKPPRLLYQGHDYPQKTKNFQCAVRRWCDQNDCHYWTRRMYDVDGIIVYVARNGSE